MLVDSVAGHEFWWVTREHQSDPTEVYQETTPAAGTGFNAITVIIDFHTAPDAIGQDTVWTDTASPSAPESTMSISAFDLADNCFIDVEIDLEAD